MRWLLPLMACLASTVVSSAEQPDLKSKVAQVAFLAQLAPKVCPGLTTNIGAVTASMAAVDLEEGELLTRYGSMTFAAAQAFIGSAHTDLRSACDQIRTHLGRNGLGLVSESSDDK